MRKFFVTFFLMGVIGFALLLKIVLGGVYNMGYRCSHKLTDIKNFTKVENIKNDSRV